MPTPPYAKLEVSVNGVGPQSGGLTCNGGEAIQFSAQSTAGWKSALWEVYVSRGVTPTFPAGWTYDAIAERWYAVGTTPPAAFTLAPKGTKPAKYMGRLIVNGATTDVTSADYREDLVDESTAIRVKSISGLSGLGFRETNQFDSARHWGGELAADIARAGEFAGSNVRFAANFTTATGALVDLFTLAGVQAGETWEIEFEGTVQCSSTGGTKFAVVAPASSVIEGWIDSSTSAITTKSYQRIVASATANATALHTVATTPAPDKVRVTVLVGTSGDLKLQIQSVTAAQTTTVFAGARFSARRLQEA